MEEGLLTTREVARILQPHGIGTEAGVRELVEKGELRAIVVEKGKRKLLRFRPAVVEEFIWRRRWARGQFLEFPTFKEMIEKVGYKIKSYFGEEPGCIAAIIPGGFPYALALLSYLVHEQGCDIELIFLQRGKTWKPELLDGKRILIVDSRTQSGKSLTKAKQVFKKLKQIEVKDLKTFAYDDHKKVADFWVYRREFKEHIENIDISLG